MGGREPARLKATFEIVTPMFLGGAAHEAERLRGASFKGALAFWWRVWRFGHFIHEKGGDAKKALRALRRRERDLFGSSSAGQGVFLLRVVANGLKILPKGKILAQDGTLIEPRAAHPKSSSQAENGPVGKGARYLGYGLLNAFYSRKTGKAEGELERSCFAAGQTFQVEIIFRPGAKANDIEEICKTLRLFGLLGGLGSRVRRGWGSVALKRLEAHGGVECSWQEPQDRDEYIRRMEGLFANHPGRRHSGKRWPLSAIARESRLLVGVSANADGNASAVSRALSALDELGRGFLRYRGWRNGDQNFPDDHDWFKQDNGNPHTSRCPPKRTAFGLPHNYAQWLGVSAPDGAREENCDRRASPLLFHIHQTADGAAFPVVLFLPTRFMYVNEVAIVQGTGENRRKTPVNYDFHGKGVPVIEAFLNNKRPDGSAPPGRDYLKADEVL